MRYVPALLSLTGLLSVTSAFAQTYCGASSYCGTPSYYGASNYCGASNYYGSSSYCCTPQVVYQHCCPQPCRTYCQAPPVCHAPPPVCYPAPTPIQEVCVVCPHIEFFVYPTFSTYYATYCYNVTGVSVYQDLFPYVSSHCDDQPFGICNNSCVSGPGCSALGKCVNIYASSSLIRSFQVAKLHNDVYTRKPGAVKVKNGKTIVKKIVEFNHNSKVCHAEVFTIELTQPIGGKNITVRIGHQIDHLEKDEMVENGKVKGPRNTHELEVHDANGDIFRVRTFDPAQ
jgi:hypothetical protein